MIRAELRFQNRPLYDQTASPLPPLFAMITSKGSPFFTSLSGRNHARFEGWPDQAQFTSSVPVCGRVLAHFGGCCFRLAKVYVREPTTCARAQQER